jgi:UDP-glucose 4-epimerase
MEGDTVAARSTTIGLRPIHMAAHSLVGESVEQPAKYLRTTWSLGLKWIDAMRDWA